MDDRVGCAAGEEAFDRFGFAQVDFVWQSNDSGGSTDLARLSHAQERTANETGRSGDEDRLHPGVKVSERILAATWRSSSPSGLSKLDEGTLPVRQSNAEVPLQFRIR